MTKSLWKISFVGVGNILNAALGFLFLTALAKSLPLDDFGRYTLTTSLLVAIAKITDFGTNSLYVAKALAQNELIKDKFLSLKIILFAVTLPISYLALRFLNFSDTTIYLLFLFGLIVYTLNFALFGLFQKIEKFEYLILLNSIPAFIKGVVAVFILLGLFSLNFTQGFLVFVGSVAPSIILFFFLPKDLQYFRPDFSGLKLIFSQSFPAGISQIIAESWSAIANSIAKIAQGFSDVGIFSLADKISTIFSLVSLSIFTVLLPKNARGKRENKKYDFKETGLISAGILLLSLCAMIFARFFIPFVFGEKFLESLPLLNILIFTSALTAIHTFTENYFFVEQKTKALFHISVFKLLVFLLGSLILVPSLALTGLAYSSLIAGISAVGLTYVLMFVKK